MIYSQHNDIEKNKKKIIILSRGSVCCVKRTFLSIFMVVLMCTVCLVPASIVNAQTMNNSEVVIDINQAISSTPVECDIELEYGGDYNVVISYSSLNEKITSNNIYIGVDTKIQEECINFEVPKCWTDDGEKHVDGQGNEYLSQPVLYKEAVDYTLTVTEGFFKEDYTVSLNQGNHTVMIFSENEEIFLEAIKLVPVTKPISYNQIKINKSECYSGKPIIVEGESAIYKSDYWLNAASDNNSATVYPANPVKIKINYIGGANWDSDGDEIFWKVNVPKAGYYGIDFVYRQNYVTNGSTYRILKVNGKVPFEEASSISFPYASDWETKVFGKDSKTPYLVWLEKGDNTVSLTATVSEYKDVCMKLNAVIDKLGELYVDINMVTGETVDIYRDYQLFDQIPDFNKRLKEISNKLGQIDKELIDLSGGEANTYTTSLRNMKQNVDMMLNNPYTAHRYKNSYYSTYTALSSCLNDMRSMPLDIDRIAFYSQKDESHEYNDVGFFDKVLFSIKRFFASFLEDYNNISGANASEDDKITVWVNWGRDQAQILNRLIQSSFSAKNNYQVNVKISNATVVQGVLSGNGPDVILQQTRTEPVNLALRGVLYDLTKFDDCDEVLNRFVEGAETPYRYKNGLYALPDTQSFMMMFYRTDVLEKLGLEVPKTWDDFKHVSKVLSRNNLNTWLPYTQITDMNLVNNGVGSLSIFPTLMIQNGVSLYNESQTATNLTTPEALDIFIDWTNYYTKLKLPYQLDFYNRFRIGSCPIGIAPYTLYNTIKDAASEIDGKWSMTELPGVELEDGTINNVSAGSGTGCAIIKSCKRPDIAWEFLKWWTSSETQLAYSNSVESVLGPIGRIAVANKEALANMSWDRNMYGDIVSAWEKTVEIQEVPGSYYVARSIDFALWNVVDSSVRENPKDSLVTWGKEADMEIARKLEQYAKRN